MCKLIHMVTIGDSNSILCVTDDIDVAKRVAYTYNTYKDIAKKVRERKHVNEFDGLNLNRKKYLDNWKFALPTTNKISGIAKVKTIEKFDVPIQLVKAYMDSYTFSKYRDDNKRQDAETTS